VKRRFLLLSVAAAATGSCAASALAFWTVGSAPGGNGRSDVGSLGRAATPIASAVGRTATVSWAQTTVSGAPLGSLAAGGYTVRRYAASAPGTPITPGASCGVSIAGSADPVSCTESGLATGRWLYSATPTYHLWTGDTSVLSAAVTVAPDAPTSVALTNGGGTGNAFVNAANATSLSFDVVLPVTSIASDAVQLAVSDGSATVNATAAGIAGGGNRSFVGVDVSGLADGALTISARTTSSYGDVSAAISTSRTKDTVKPGLSTLITADLGGTAGKLDSVTATFTEPLAAYAAGTSPWALTNVPSGGSLSSVAVVGPAATLSISEGAGAIDTSVGSFTVALATSSAGVRDAAGNLSSFSATSPNDGIAAVRTGLVLQDVTGNGKVDRVSATFSETLASSTDTAPWTLANVPSSGALSGVSTAGAVATLAISEGAGAASTAVGTMTVALAAGASGIRDAAGNQSSFAAAGPSDGARPALLSVAMLDSNANGKVDRVSAVFSETLAAYSAGTAPWTLASVPSAGTLASVAVATATATLTINEGAGTVDTTVGSFTLALATSATGIRDAAANLASFGATAPADGAAPVRTAMLLQDVSANGKVDQVSATFSEALASSTDTAPWTAANVPSSGALSGVSTSGAVATLAISEGAGAADTAVGSFTLALVASATGIRDAAGNQVSFAAAAPTDGAKPVLVTSTMLDSNTNGKVDRVSAVFSETLAAYSAGTAPWTLANVPSGGTLASVAVATTTATPTITEGAAAANTAVGGSTVALATSATGIRDAAANQSSFAAVAPADAAAPVPVSITTTVPGATAGLLQLGDALAVTFSEAILASSVPAGTTITEIDPNGTGNDTLTITGLTSGARTLGANNYVSTNNTTAAFASSVLSVAGATVTATVAGTCTGTCGANLTAGQGALAFAPATTVTDAAGNPAAGTFTTAATFRAF